MMAQRTMESSLKANVGKGMVVLGAAVLSAYWLPVAVQLQGLLEGVGGKATDLALAAGLALLHGVQQVVFGMGLILPLMRHLLVLCWPFLLIVAGVALLNSKRGETMTREPRERAAGMANGGVRS